MFDGFVLGMGLTLMVLGMLVAGLLIDSDLRQMERTTDSVDNTNNHGGTRNQ